MGRSVDSNEFGSGSATNCSAIAFRRIVVLCLISSIPIAIVEADGASGKDKLFSRMLATDVQGGSAIVLHDYKRCHLHQNLLIITSLVQVFGNSVLAHNSQM